MPTAYIDRVDDLSLVERNGAFRSLVRKARVGFTQDERYLDFNVLVAALDAVPAYGSRATDINGLNSPGFSSLILVERTPKLVENDPSWVDVTLKYEHLLDGPNQSILNSSGILFGKGKCSISEKTTNFYRPFGDPNAEKVQIEVGHTFAPGTSGANNKFYDPDLNPFTVKQGGEVTIPFPQANFQLVGVLSTFNPWSVADQFIAVTNSGTWQNKPPRTWICSEVQWEMLDANPRVNIRPLYRFGFEFQYNIDTWRPTVVFINQETGRPPADVVKANIPDFDGVLRLTAHILTSIPQPAGYWEVPVLKEDDFNRLFGAFFEGLDAPIAG